MLGYLHYTKDYYAETQNYLFRWEKQQKGQENEDNFPKTFACQVI